MQERTPERIYGWMNSQLSIARFYGGVKYNGAEYVIAPDEEGQPLVRMDVKFPRKPKAARGKKASSSEPMRELPLPPNARIEPDRCE